MRDLSSRTLHAIRMVGACAALLVASGLAADAAEPAAAPEKFTYIVVLHDRAPKDGHSDVAEPDIPALGGEVLHQWRNRRVVRMPDAAVRALVAHRGVKYIQRVQTDGKLPGLPQSESVASTGAVEANWAPPTWFSGEYVYDGDGNIKQIGTAASPSSDGGGDSYAYDSAGRLVSVVANHGTTHSEKYSYDSFGNLVNTERTAGPSTATPTFTASNRLQGVTYDNVGNVIATEGGAAEYMYDGMNMLRAKSTSTGVASYIYTADDERIGVQENGQTRWMIRDLEGRVLREWEGNSSWWLWVEDYVHRGGVVAAAEREPAEGGTRHFHLDHLGTARLLTDSNRAKIALHDYFPFGVERTNFRQEMMDRGTDRPEPMKFTGHERDFTGGIGADNRNQLDYMHARYYSPVWGRFLSVDPELNSEKIKYEPQQWNRYSYVTNNPLKYTDPDGRDKFMAWLLGSAFKDVSTWEALTGAFTGRDFGPAMSQGVGDWAEDHREMTGGFSPVPTTRGEVAIAPVLMMLGPGGGAARTTLAEAKVLVGSWGKGTFQTLSKTIAYHFEKHGAEVGAKNALQYMRKAFEFGRNTKGATKTLLENGATRYEKAGRYIIKDNDGKIISFGAV